MSGAFGTNWLDLSSASNRYIQTYYKGFVDISGGPLYVRNNNLFVQGGDISLNGRLYGAGDISLNSRLYVGSDVSMGGKLFTVGDTSHNARLFVGGDVSMQGRLFTVGDTSHNAKLFVGSDASFGGNLYVTGIITTPTFFTGNIGTSSINTSQFAKGSFTSSSTSPPSAALIKSSSSGQYAFIAGGTAGGPNGVYITTNYGINWTNIPTSSGLPASQWSDAAISSNGQYGIAGSWASLSTGQLWYTNNYGVTWSLSNAPQYTGGNWLSMAMSASGKYALAGGYGRGIYYSSNYGQSWTQSNVTNGYWTGGSAITDGGYAVASSQGGGSYYSTNFGQTNTISNLSTGQWALSLAWSNGLLGVAGGTGLYYTTNGGQTWTVSNVTTGTFQQVSIDSTGQYCIAGSNSNIGVYYSTNSGQTWTQTSLTTGNYFAGISGNGTYNYVITSSTASYQVNQIIFLGKNPLTSITDVSINGSIVVSGAANIGNAVYVTSDASLQGRLLLGGDLSANSRLYVGSDVSFGGRLYVAGDVSFAGNLYTKYLYCTGNPPANAFYTTLQNTSFPYGSSAFSTSTQYKGQYCTSSSGQYHYIATANGTFYYSINYGSTFTASSITSSSDVACSSTGQYVAVGTLTASLYVSSNYASTFTTVTLSTPTAGYATSVTMSSDGQYMVAWPSGVQSYNSSNYGVTFTGTGLLANRNMRSISMSSSGQYVFGSGNNTIETSTNYGASYSELVPMGGSWLVKCSSSGQYVGLLPLFGGTNTTGYVSINYGTNYTSFTSPVSSTYSFTMDPTGTYWFVLGSGGAFTSSNYGTSWTSVTLTGYVSAISNLVYSASSTGLISYTYPTLNTQMVTTVSDISMNSRLYVGSDASFGGKLFLAADASLNGNVSIANDLTVNGNFYVKAYTTRQMITELSYQLIIAEDISVNGRLFLSNDASINNRLFVGSDVSMGGKLFTVGDTSHNARLYVGSDVSLGGRLFVAGDLSVNGNVNVNGLLTAVTQTSTDNSTKVATTAYVKSVVGGISNTYFATDVSMASRLLVVGDASMNGNVNVTGTINILSTQFSLQTALTSSTGTPATGSFSFCAMSNTGYGVASHSSGLYKTSDGGITWSLLNSGVTTISNGQGPSALFIDTTGQYVLYLNTNSGYYYSTNYGSTFQACGTIGSLNNTPTGMAGGTGAGCIWFNSTTAYYTTNYGATWTASTTPIPSLYNYGNIAVSGNGAYMYKLLYSANQQSVYYSVDGGNNWSLRATLGFTYNYWTGCTSYTGQYVLWPGNSNNVVVSSDYGATWKNIAVTGATIAYQSLCFMSASGQYQYVNGAYSLNYGVTWTASSSYINAMSNSGKYILNTLGGVGIYYKISILSSSISSAGDASLNGNLYVGLNSSIGGNFYTAGNVGIGKPSTTYALDVSGNVNMLALTSTNIYASNTIYVVNDLSVNSNLYVNNSFINTITPFSYVTSLTSSTGTPATGSFSFCAMSNTGYGMASHSSGLYSTSNGGNSWSLLNSGVTTISNGQGPSALFMDTTGQYVLYLNTNSGYYYSTNYGSTFQACGTIGSLTNTPTGMAGGTGAGCIWFNSTTAYYTTNYGATWTASTTPIPSPYNYGNIAVSGNGAYMYKLLYSANQQSVYYSVDGGNNWSLRATLGFTYNYWTGCTSYTGQYVLWPGNSNNVVVSSDYGATWSNIAVTGATIAYQSLCFMSASGQYQYVNGAYSNNYGVTWVPSTTYINAMSSSARYILNTLGGVGIYYKINALNPTIINSGDVSLNANLYVGNTIYANNALYLTRDASFNARLFVGSDVSFGGKLFLAADASLNGNVSVGSDLTVNGNMYVKAYTTRQMITELSYQLIIAEDISVNGRLFLSNDASINNRLFVGSDVSMGGKLFTLGDASLNARLYVGADASFGGNFYVGKNVGIAKAPTYPLDISGISRTSGGVILGTLPTTKYYTFAGTPSTATITTPSLTFTFGNSSFYARFHCFLSDASTNTVSTVVFDVQGGNAAGTAPSNTIAEITRVSTINGYYQWLQPTYTTTTVVLGTTANTGVVANYSVRVELIQTNAVAANVPTLNSITMVNNNAGGTVVTSFAY